MFKTGDKVLVEGVVVGAARDVVDVLMSGKTEPAWYSVGAIRPWTEKPTEPVREVWRGKLEDGSHVAVMSNGVAGFLSLKDGKFEPSSEYAAAILAEYVRQTAGGKP